MVAFGLTGGGFEAFAQHVHLYAGASSQLQGSKLMVVNASTYDINSNGGIAPECFYMSDNDPVLYPGLYQSDATFAALPATLCAGGPAPNCALVGFLHRSSAGFRHRAGGWGDRLLAGG